MVSGVGLTSAKMETAIPSYSKMNQRDREMDDNQQEIKAEMKGIKGAQTEI